MNVDIEFFDEDPMSNVLACLKFAFSKVIFLGYVEEDMDKVAESTVTAFLKSPKIGVEEIEFVAVPEGRLDDIEKKLTEIVVREKAAGNQCYFDLTGGEELVLAAAGVVADQEHIPMHEIDLAEDEVRIQAMPECYEALPKRNYRLNIEEYLNLHEGVIEQGMHKKINTDLNQKVEKERLFELKKFTDRLELRWNGISTGIAYFCSRWQGVFLKDRAIMAQAARVAHMKLNKFLEKLETMRDEGILEDFIYNERMIRIQFYSEMERELLCNPGAILEHAVYWKIMEDPEVNDCVIGYHINWVGDGDPMSVYKPGPNVVNEVDVIFMKKNIPTFVSCKNFIVSNNHPLYELETIADRFGGALVRKVLVTRGGVSENVANRAREMGIIVKDAL